MPWQKQYDETKVLDRAMAAFWARGYEATSVSDLVAATGINRGSLYNAFADKRGLFLRALAHYDQRHRRDFLAALAEEHPPRDAILAAFQAVVRTADGGRNRKGCLLVNTALELAPHDREIEQRVAASLAEVERFFRERIEAAQQAGTIAPEVPAAERAQLLFTLFLGLRVITRSGANEALMTTVVAQAEALLD